MKVNQKDSEKVIWEHTMRSSSAKAIFAATSLPSRGLPKLFAWLLVFAFLTYTLYTVKLMSSSRSCVGNEYVASVTHFSSLLKLSKLTGDPDAPSSSPPPPTAEATDLRHVVFGIATSAKLWEQRKEYIKLW